MKPDFNTRSMLGWIWAQKLERQKEVLRRDVVNIGTFVVIFL